MSRGQQLVLFCLLAFGAGLAGRCGGSTGAPCDGVDCGGHGICFSVADSTYCECAAGWHPSGLECVRNDATNPCLDIDCDGHGSCVLDAARVPGCNCEAGYVERSALHCLPLITDDADADADGEVRDGEAEAEAEADVCVPSCAGRACGGDGCGGSCGSCPTGTSCSGGTCVCVADCAGRECGTDGCGGSCGSCPSGTSCGGAGRCRCTPDCGGRECGDDGCGGDCGGCPSDYDCDSGSCVLVCHPPDTHPIGGACVPSCGVAGGNHCPPRVCESWEDYDPVGYDCCPSSGLLDTWDCREGDDRPANNYCCAI